MRKLKNLILKNPVIPLTMILSAFALSVCFVQILDRTKIRRKKPIEYIIVHYTANNSSGADATMNAIYLQRKRAAGTHYCIDDEYDGEGIIQCTKEENVAYAIGDRYWSGFKPKPWLINSNGSRKVLNNNSLSYEMCLGGGRNDSTIIERTAQQIGWQLVNKGLDISRVLRHHDVTGKPCPKFFYNENWNEAKEDSCFNEFKKKVQFYQTIHLIRKKQQKLEQAKVQ